ncbi:MAG TPA: glycosyltransferase family 4 protein [Candidatus Limnocylindria bacterium]|jgi:glycosyltransferase involved in cell wall biosynthesis|nr:glycosyltransferase family 4 protein [Candidatus Limnocylindria bacterium]
MRIAFVASSIPRRCGIATFTADLSAAVKAADPTVRVLAAAIDEPGAARPYGPDVRWRIRQEEAGTYRDAALAISASNVDIASVQHEFGLYGVWHDGTYDDYLRVFLESCTKPVVTTLHTVPPKPEPWALDTIRFATDHSEQVIVMGTTAARLLRDVYGVSRPPVVIEHGMPAIEPRGRHRLKRQLGVQERQIISTFGLVDPRKGLEYVIEAMPEIVARHPDALYLVVGQTHPELLKKEGEAYRNSLTAAAARLELRDRVKFVNQYLTQREVVDYLLATDVYVTPYLDPNQITSGTLAYALGAGKAIVSTPYLHAQEVLEHGRGILVPFRDAAAIATAVNSVLGDPDRKRELELRAYEYGKEMAWPAIGRRVLSLMRDVLDHRVTAQAVPLLAPAQSGSQGENSRREEQPEEEPTPIG